MTPKQALELAAETAQQGDLTGAADLYRQVLRKAPKHAAARKQLRQLEKQLAAPRRQVSQRDFAAIQDLFEQQKFAQAETLISGLVRVVPGQGVLLNLKGLSQTRQGKSDAALESFRLAMRLEPANPDFANNVALQLKEMGRLGEAAEIAEAVVAQHPSYGQAHHNLGSVELARGNYDRAETAFLAALKLSPNVAQTHTEYGMLLATKGQRDPAIASFKAAIGLNPDHYDPYVRLAALEKLDPDSPTVAAMERISVSDAVPDLEKALLHFALGRVFEQAGEVDRSFDHYATGNSLQRSFGHFSIAETAAEFSALKSRFPVGRALPAPQAEPAGPNPIFIVGMNRSGTSLVEQILDCHSGINGCGELELVGDFAARFGGDPDKMTAADVAEFAKSYRAELAEKSDKPFATDKMPINFKWIGLIQQTFPNAPVLFLDREARDVCFSNFKASFGVTGHMYCYDQVELARYYRMHLDLIDHWRLVFPDKLLTVKYEDLVAETEAEVRKILAFCGLAWEPQVLDFHASGRAVTTLSQNQVRQKVYASSIGAWKPYAHHLEPMLTALADDA